MVKGNRPMTLVGAGYRPELAGLFHSEQPAVDCFELIADRYFGDKGFGRAWELRRIADVPKITHGLCGNAASVHGPETAYLEQIRRLADAIDAIAYSDHLALTGVTGRALGHLAPNLFDDELLAAAAATSPRWWRDRPPGPAGEPGDEDDDHGLGKYTPEEFYLRLLEESEEWDCLLDLTNIWINSRNRDVDPVEFIDAIPPHRIGYIHLAGGMLSQGEWVDSHSNAVHAEVFELLDHLLARAAPEAIIIERDSNWTGAETELRDDLSRVRQIVAKHQPRTPPGLPSSRRRRSRSPPPPGRKAPDDRHRLTAEPAGSPADPGRGDRDGPARSAPPRHRTRRGTTARPAS